MRNLACLLENMIQTNSLNVCMMTILYSSILSSRIRSQRNSNDSAAAAAAYTEED